MSIYLILEPVTDPDGLDIERDAPRLFTNIDDEPFEFTWDSRPFGGIFPDRMVAKQVLANQKIINREGFPEVITDKKTIYECTKPIAPGETITMPKYLVNYAANHLARKIYKRQCFALFKDDPEKMSHAPIRFVNPAEEIKLMKKIVAKNLPGQEVEEASKPTKASVMDNSIADKRVDTGKPKEEKTEKAGFKCDQCEFEAKSEFGLKSHRRKHNK